MNVASNRTTAELLTLASQFTVNRNTAEPGDYDYRPDLVLHVERERTGRWVVSQCGLVYNLDTGRFDDDRTVRYAEGNERDAYVLDRDEALDLAHALPVDVLFWVDSAWRWRRG
jgi:hypothetical protein